MKKPPADPKTCASCAYFAPVNPSDEAGYCHRYPREWIVRNEEGGWAYPEQARTDTCGEWSRRLNS
jgi:hypothetical protein